MTPIPDMEALVGKLVRDHADMVALDANVSGQLPDDFQKGWIRITQIDAQNDPSSSVDGSLVSYLLQLDCYAGATATKAHRGQTEASSIARTARAILSHLQSTVQGDVVITNVAFRTHSRIPDLDFKPQRERYVLVTDIHAYNKRHGL